MTVAEETKTKLLEGRVDAARTLGICVRQLDYLIASKELRPVVRIGKRVLIPRSTLEAFVRREAR